jgi:GTPase
VEETLFEAGAVAGAEVVIGDDVEGVVFDWEPTLIAGAGAAAAPRGSDLRLEDSGRPTREIKRDLYESRRVAKRDARAELADERAAGLWTDPEVDAGLDPELDRQLDDAFDEEGVDGR